MDSYFMTKGESAMKESREIDSDAKVSPVKADRRVVVE
jgi:hypothetical protein